MRLPTSPAILPTSSKKRQLIYQNAPCADLSPFGERFEISARKSWRRSLKKTPICSPSTPATPGMLWRCSACTAAAARRSARSRPSRSGDRERALTGRTCTKPEHAHFVMLRFFDILKKAVFIPKCSFFPCPPGDVRHDSAANRYPYSHWQCRDLF